MKLPLWRRHQDEELDEEIAGHLRMAIADRVARGESPDEAARAARLEFGNVGVVKEVTRDVWGWTAIEQLAQDVRYACRTLRKAPGFTAVAVITLALGIGANSAMFSVINAVLLRPLPFPSPDALVAVSEVDLRRDPGGGVSRSASWPNFFDWRARSQAFEHLSAYRDAGFTLAGGGRSIHVAGAVVSSDLFSTLGTQPVLGRGFRLEDERGGEVAVISDSLWRSEFAAAPDIVGRPIALNARRFTIIGVMPAAFHFPISVPPAQLWVTVAEDARVEHPDDAPMTTQRGAHFLKAIGRLRRSATIASAQADLDVIAAALAREFPDDNGQRGVRVARQLDVLVGDTRQSLLVLLAAVGCVLLIACVNLANLLLARGAGRSHEIAMRTALGASARRIVRQLLTESLVLTTLGTACGLALAYGSIAAVVRWAPTHLRGLDQVAIDATVLAFTTGIAIVSALAFGIVPAVAAARTDPTLGSQGASRATAGRTQRRLRSALVVAETAVGVVLLVGAGLLLRSFDRLVRTHPGFDPERVVTATFRLPDSRYPYREQVAFYDRLLADLGAMPDIEATAAAAPLPMSGSSYSISFQQEGRPAPPGERQSAAFGMVSPGYFRAMRIPLMSGRDVTAADNDAAPRVVVVNESFARRYFPDVDPIGKRIKPGLSTTEKDTPWRQIVGVVGDIRQRSLGEPTVPAYFVPYAQGLISPLRLVIRTRTTTGIAEEVRKVIVRMDPEVAVYDVKTMEEYLATSVAGPRFQTLLLVVFAGVGLALTAVGLYGVMAYGVAQRTREFGIRLALGARPGEVLAHVMRGGLMLVAIGLGAGILAAGFATDVLAGALYGVDRLDPATFLGVAAVLLAVAMLASYLPARRATRVDPIRALRSE
jgi:predicted permease